MKCIVRRQTSIALKNEPGQLATVCRLLAEQRINIDALSIIDNVEQGVIRLLTSDPALSRELLTRHGCYVVEAEILEVEMRNVPGALATVAHQLAIGGINIEYAYGTESGTEGAMRVCFKVSDPSEGRRILEEHRGTR